MKRNQGRPNYDMRPKVPLAPGGEIWAGSDLWGELRRAASTIAQPVVVIDTYPGTDLDGLLRRVEQEFDGFDVIDVESRAALSSEDIDMLIGSNLTDDRVFGVMSWFSVQQFYDAQKLRRLRDEVAGSSSPIVLVGWGASLAVETPDILVLADLARWEIQQRQRAGAPSWRAHNNDEDPLRKYKRGFFVEWRAADRHKRRLLPEIDYLIDANPVTDAFVMIEGAVLRDTLRSVTKGPFRVVPYFDPGVWGGQWMKNVLGLTGSSPNYAWCFDCVPEENSLMIESGTLTVEIPALDLVLLQPRALLGERTYARFGADFPIRFDFLDTVEGGNLSLQVHPLTDYIQQNFGMPYTQDESYYFLHADNDAVVYLGLKDDIDRAAFERELRAAERGESEFPTDDYVNRFPVKTHDHVTIPAGTVHCSGAGSMVLEISSTPNLFTFKLWDWGRKGLDGRPRPIHLDHGLKNIDWNRGTSWVQKNLVNAPEPVTSSAGSREERTGLHSLEFIEVRRHWFTESAAHDTDGTVNVLNLVEGDEVEVVSPSAAFEPFVVHYAETFIVPAAVGQYVIRRTSRSTSASFATVKAYVRGTRESDSEK